MSDRTKTGKVRFRQWKGKLVLQLQERFIHTYWAGNIESEWVTVWRDATVEDITVIR